MACFRPAEPFLETLFPEALAHLYYVAPRWQVDRGMDSQICISLAGLQIAHCQELFALLYTKPDGRVDLKYLIVPENIARE